MYTAILLVCHTIIANDCAPVFDKYGPYKTEDECMIRLEQMSADIMTIFRKENLPLEPQGYKCEKNGTV
jgi:hypothetical protein